MGSKLMAIIAVAGITAVGLAALPHVFEADPTEKETTSMPTVVAQVAAIGELGSLEPTQAQLDFRTMAVEPDQPECRPPRPPKELAQLALTRNGYAAILEIMAMRRWKNTDSCECFYVQITWDDVQVAAHEFERTDGVNLRFDVPKLRVKADLLTAQRSKVCPR
ncbi:hypothetical protein FEE96_22435 [Parasedimentitalea maritima]|uniref:Uncharacterized protein n=1 Tax=Parasedimentitalea maritima TaxID=2578117 RepID=A0ABY2USJ3_9RHOB|nr:hypothetical protein [Zongyanglinia marina]TLP55481.1 hypothetical protein FEE96_22435 [Zongyanglinia marina]